VKKFQEWAKREYSLKQRLITLGFAGVFFLLILPVLLIRAGTALDQRLNLPKFDAGAANDIAGLILVLGGGILGFWSIYAQVTIGDGTPLPMMPTQKLVVKAPFTYCRNPMTLGTFLAYLGISVWIGSWSAVAIVLVFIGCLLLYVRFIEEKELEARYGLEYVKYRRNTPFIVPRLRPRH